MKRQSRRERECAGGLEQTAFQDAFLPHPRECAGKRIFGRKSKTLEIISFNAPAQSVPVTRGQGQSPALEAGVQANLRATSPREEADALARADALKPLRVKTSRSGSCRAKLSKAGHSASALKGLHNNLKKIEVL